MALTPRGARPGGHALVVFQAEEVNHRLAALWARAEHARQQPSAGLAGPAAPTSG